MKITKKVNQEKRMETLIHVYQAMDEQRREKMELMAKGLLDVQMLAGGEKPMPGMKKKTRAGIKPAGFLGE
jgi:hypothetical protein